MKRKTTRTTKRPTAKRANPRYLISRDGVEVGIYPGFTSVEAVKRAKAQYGRGKYTAEKISADMYLGRGGEDSEAAERLQRQQDYRAHRLSKAKRNPRKLATKEELMRIIMNQKLDVHPYPRGKYPYTVDWKFRDGKIFAIEFPDRTALVDSQYLRRRNGTHIHAENIDHLDVSRVHNPLDWTDKYVVIALGSFIDDSFGYDYYSLRLEDRTKLFRAVERSREGADNIAGVYDVYQGFKVDEFEDTFIKTPMRVVIDPSTKTVSVLENLPNTSKSEQLNPARPVRRIAYTLGTWWQPYIEYGDDSDVSIEEIAQWESFRKRLEPGGHWSFNEDTYFGKDDVTGKRGDVSDAVYVIVG